MQSKINKLLDDLLKLHPKYIDLSLNRLIKLLKKLGDPHLNLPKTIHIAGTNGKGSVQSFIRNILISNGYSCDAYISPHLSKFNERRKIYVIGEVSQPIIIDMKLEAITLSDALGQAKGISVTTSNSDAIYLVRMSNEKPTIYKLDISDPTGFHNASKFYLQPQDLIFVGASDVTRWNRVIAQVFPFASFLNAIDNLTSSDS